MLLTLIVSFLCCTMYTIKKKTFFKRKKLYFSWTKRHIICKNNFFSFKQVFFLQKSISQEKPYVFCGWRRLQINTSISKWWHFSCTVQKPDIYLGKKILRGCFIYSTVLYTVFVISSSKNKFLKTNSFWRWFKWCLI